eukprot:TRINITY_DN48254_c0_g1_i1.p1 TRINITY_DN48254_c0_g1~~TRINITY_DN48254_c0_g1_i1.p1  ORF type:complete len:385 (-),score=51.66 TRINITY_DN48254_c0_g1_i1:37-1161(-)
MAPAVSSCLEAANKPLALRQALVVVAAASAGALIATLLTKRRLQAPTPQHPGVARGAGGKKASPASTALKLASEDVVANARREVVCSDAIQWLKTPGVVHRGALVFTSLPDVSEVREFAPTVEAWEAWFVDAVKHVLLALPPGGLAVFYQTDIRIPGRGQVSKSFAVLRAAAELGSGATASLRWHKIVHFENVDKAAQNSATVKYTHLMCFCRDDGETSQAKEFVDDTVGEFGGLIPDIVGRGQKPWGIKNAARCMGAGVVYTVLNAAIKRLPQVDTVIDPFCGAGTVLAVSNALGLHAIGVDISPRRVKQAKSLDGARLLAGRPREEKQPEKRGKVSTARGSSGRGSNGGVGRSGGGKSAGDRGRASDSEDSS